ncbi:hypothetical protein GQ457_04G029960 [Hibiscus cannabinus]
MESVCQLCCNWLEKSSSAPNAFKYVIKDILQYGAGLDWSIKVIPREENGTADRLTKNGISRNIPFVYNPLDYSKNFDVGNSYTFG